MPPGMGPGGHGGRGYLTEEELANRPKVTGALLARIFSYLKPYWKQLVLVLVCIVVSSYFSLLPSILTGRIIDEGLIGRDLGQLIKLIILSLAVTLGANLIGVAESYLNTWIAQHITFDMRNSMFRHLQAMSQRFFTANNQGDIITRMTSDIDGVKTIITNTFTNILSNAVTLIVALVAMFQKNSILAFVGLLVVPLFTLPTRKAGKTRWTLTREAQAYNDEINGVLNETLSVSGRVVIVTFSSIGPMLLYLVGGILMIRYDQSLTVGDITVLVALLGRMYGPVNNLLNIQVDWIRSMALFTRIFEYYDMPLEIENPPDAKIPDEVTGTVRFDHVDFHYEPSRQILKDVSFTLNAGDCIAIVGPSGSGKSTMINLIPRLYDSTGGTVFFDGMDVKTLDLRWLRKNIGIVTQDTYLFNGTIRENLLYAKPDATEEDLVEACRKANIYEFIENQPDGLDTMVGNRGLKLSGGEKQRLSIARVLLKDPALLIFDEATSALDSISEKAIQDAIDPLIKARTSILIAHRLSTILAADEILVLQDGKIVEKGQHNELVALGGVYTRLYETQFSKAAQVPARTQSSDEEAVETMTSEHEA